MAFESVRAYVQLASGLSDLTRARAQEIAQGLLSVPAAGFATSTRMASQATALADELLAAAGANRSNLTALVRSEVDAAILTRLRLVPVQELEEAQAEAAELREEVAALRSASSNAPGPKSPAKKTAPVAKSRPRRTAVPKTAAKKTAANKTAANKPATAHRSAVTTRAKPAVT